MNLINIRRAACGVTELSDIRKKYNVPVPEAEPVCAPSESQVPTGGLTAEDVEAITRAVLAKLRG
jgi:hypothetical protein